MEPRRRLVQLGEIEVELAARGIRDRSPPFLGGPGPFPNGRLTLGDRELLGNSRDASEWAGCSSSAISSGVRGGSEMSPSSSSS